MVQGLPRAASTCWWLVDRQDLFQIELFEFRSPLVATAAGRLAAVRHRLFDGRRPRRRSRRRGRARSRRPVASRSTEPVGDAGRASRLRARPRGGAGRADGGRPAARRAARAPAARSRRVAARSVTLSVPRPRALARFFERRARASSRPTTSSSTGPSTRRCGASTGAERESRAAVGRRLPRRAGRVHGAARAGRGRDGYRISDQGLLNVAFGFRDRREFEAACRRCAEAGLERNGAPLRFGAWSVVYVNDDQGFSVELLHVGALVRARRWAFSPRSQPRSRRSSGAPRRRRAGAFDEGARHRRGGRDSAPSCARLLAGDGTDLVLARPRRGRRWPRRRTSSDAQARWRDCRGRLRPTSRRSTRSAARSSPSTPDVDLVFAVAGLDRAQSLLAFDWRQARDDFTVNALANLVLLSHLAAGDGGAGRGHVTAIASLAALARAALRGRLQRQQGGAGRRSSSPRAPSSGRAASRSRPCSRASSTPRCSGNNAFRHTYSIPARDAAERIHRATLERDPSSASPAASTRRPGSRSSLPARIRDRLAREAMTRTLEGRRAMTDDLARLDATAQAELVRDGEASPLELVDAAIARIEALNPRAQRGHPPAVRAGARGGGGRAARTGPSGACRSCSRTSARRSPASRCTWACSCLKDAGFRAPVDTYLAQRFRAAGLRDVGKTNTPELGILPTTEPDAYGPTPQPVGPRALDRRLERRLRRGGRRRHGPDRARQRRRRLDPDPGRARAGSSG